MNVIMLRMIQSIDRPTNNTLVYLTKVRKHPIVPEEQLRDPFVEQSIREVLSESLLEEFESFTKSYYTLEGHYANLWLYDRPLTNRTDDPVYYQALESFPFA